MSRKFNEESIRQLLEDEFNNDSPDECELCDDEILSDIEEAEILSCSEEGIITSDDDEINGSISSDEKCI